MLKKNSSCKHNISGFFKNKRDFFSMELICKHTLNFLCIKPKRETSLTNSFHDTILYKSKIFIFNK